MTCLTVKDVYYILEFPFSRLELSIIYVIWVEAVCALGGTTQYFLPL